MTNIKQHSKLIISIIVAIIGIYTMGQWAYFRFDITADKRYTLSASTKELLKQIKEPVLIEVLLSGDIPTEYKGLQSEVLQLLQEYKALNNNILYKFINPLQGADNPQPILEELLQYGLAPVQVTTQKQGTTANQYMLPWALISIGEKAQNVPLLKNKLGASNEERISLSIQNLEYAFSDALYKLILKKEKSIAVLRSHGTLSDMQMADFLQLESTYYNIAPFTLDSVATNASKTLAELTNFQLLLVPKPTKGFSEPEKQVLDQFVMQGGRILWLLDTSTASLEELINNQGVSVVLPLELNLADVFFRYGFRLNNQLVKDLYATPIVLAQGEGSQTQYAPLPWGYYPMIITQNNHLITNNLDGIRLQFVSPIDTLSNGINKTILLSSSPQSKVEGVPKELNLHKVFSKTEEKYPLKNIPLGVLLEGNFTSAYKNRIKPIQLENQKEEGNFSKMIVISDGDIIRNDLTAGQPLELGYDKWTNNFYDNKLFLQNCVNYLLDDTQFLSLRNKTVSIAFLNKEKLQKKAQFWKLMSIVAPLVFIALMGIALHFYLKKEYSGI